MTPKLEAFIEGHRNWNVDLDGYWYECLFNDLKEDMEAIGVSLDVDDIQFSGFWGQGDGASFTGSVDSGSMVKFMDAHNMATDYPAAYLFAKHQEFYINMVRSCNAGNYSHHNTVNIDIGDAEEMGNQYPEGSIRHAAYEAMEEKWLSGERDEFEAAAKEILHGFMQKLYKDLEAEHDYQTTDEAVLESLLANEQVPEELLEEATQVLHELQTEGASA